MELIGFLFGLVSLIIFVLMTILLGSWMLRINDVIDYQEQILKELKTLNSKKEQ